MIRKLLTGLLGLIILLFVLGFILPATTPCRAFGHDQRLS